MLFISIILILLFDTLIRFEPDSKFKLFWVKKFPNSFSSKIDKLFTKIKNRIINKLKEKNKVSDSFIYESFLSLEDFITLIPSRFAMRFFWIGLTILILYCFQILYTLIF
jgi:hypothetical protein